MHVSHKILELFGKVGGKCAINWERAYVKNHSQALCICAQAKFSSRVSRKINHKNGMNKYNSTKFLSSLLFFPLGLVYWFLFLRTSYSFIHFLIIYYFYNLNWHFQLVYRFNYSFSSLNQHSLVPFKKWQTASWYTNSLPHIGRGSLRYTGSLIIRFTDAQHEHWPPVLGKGFRGFPCINLPHIALMSWVTKRLIMAYQSYITMHVRVSIMPGNACHNMRVSLLD
jgi:hypothetical protein